MTVEEYRKLPEAGPVYYELHHGQVVTIQRPKLKHSLIQQNLCELLKPYAEPASYVDVGVAFRPLPEHELWTADVAYVSAARFHQADPEDNIHGAPDLVIEVLSPSNTAAEMYDREQTCLTNGAREFWVVDPDRRQVNVSTPDGHTVTWHARQSIPLTLLAPNAQIPVDDIFHY